MSNSVLLVGLGFMGQAYADVLKALGRPTIAVGQSVSGANNFTATTGINAETGGLQKWLQCTSAIPESAIICVTSTNSLEIAKILLAAGVKHILIEKPGGSTVQEIETLANAASEAQADVSVAYNRRFYSSVLEAERRITAEGGVTSFHFEFTERERDAISGKFGTVAQQNWALANSSHVFDLAFFLGGTPVRISAEVSGSLPWHMAGAHFAGSGLTDTGAVFSYCANWSSGGRWGVEIMTRESRLILRPLEELQIQRRGSFVVEPVAIDNELDLRFKPGLYRQTIAFLNRDEQHRFLSIQDQARRAVNVYSVISGEGHINLT